MEEPKSVYERTIATAVGMRVSVHARTFSRGGEPASAVTLAVAVGSGYFTQLPNDAGAATALLSSAEARAVAARLVEAADAADAAAPGLLDQGH
jgi:hypothetical protein